MTIDEFIKELAKLNIIVTNDILKKLDIYFECLIDYNKHTNLTTITNKKDVYLKHFFDSLTVTKVYSFDNDIKVLDIGSGAGFPGLVLKLFFPNINIVLLDSNHKKTKFLELICEKLELSDVIIENKRAEDYIKENREQFDIVISRAVAKTRILSEISLPFLKNNGYLIIMKASDEVTNEEINQSYSTLKVLNSIIEKKISFQLPIERSQRNIILIKKLNNIDILYPRSYDKILKKPLK